MHTYCFKLYPLAQHQNPQSHFMTFPYYMNCVESHNKIAQNTLQVDVLISTFKKSNKPCHIIGCKHMHHNK